MFERKSALTWVSAGLMVWAGFQWLQNLSGVAWFAGTLISVLGTLGLWNMGPGRERWGEASNWRLVMAAASGVALLIALGQWIVVGASGPEACIPGALQLILLVFSAKNRP